MEETTEHIEDKDTANIIISMMQEDQAKLKETGGYMDQSLNHQHTAKLKEIIAKIGWPTKSSVGSEASQAAWLITQHADADPEFQEDVLKRMKEVPEEAINQQNIAYLEDRVRVNKDEPQLYGTQFDVDGQGKYGPLPIADPEGLAQRRKKMGLNTLEEQTQIYQKMYNEVMLDRASMKG